MQIKACLNSRPLTLIPAEGDGLEALTPGHLLVVQPLEVVPDHVDSYWSLSTLSFLQHFWQRWSNEYVVSLHRYNKWRYLTRNVRVGDIVVVQDEALVIGHFEE